MDTDIDNLADRLRTAIGVLRRQMRDLDAGGLSLLQISTMVRLDRVGPATSADLARAERVTPQSMGSIVRSLEELGFVSRASDRHDGRRVLLSTTSTGRTLLRSRARKRDDRLGTAVRAEFSANELETFASLLGLLERLATQLAAQAPMDELSRRSRLPG